MSREFDAGHEAPHEERRRFDRSRLIVDVHFDGADATGIASTKDISPGGLYMNTQRELPEGALLALRIPFEGGDVVVNAEVIYTNAGRGVGVRFRDLGGRERAAIERALAED
jgi:hypothetical protein